MSSGIQAGTVFPVAVKNDDDVEHRRRLADAINHLGGAVFVPATQLDTISAVDFTDAGADLGFSIEVTPFVPAYAFILAVLQIANNDGAADLNATVELKENGSVIATLSNVYAPTTVTPMVIQSLRTLEPDTTYTYTITGTEGAAEDGAATADSTLSVRVEHRRVTV